MVKNLKYLRLRAGMSQKQLADKLIVSQQSINKYENHDVEPNIETLCAMAELFHVSVDFLIGYSEVERKSEPTAFCELNGEEEALIGCFRTLSRSDRRRLLDLAERFRNEKTT